MPLTLYRTDGDTGYHVRRLARIIFERGCRTKSGSLFSPDAGADWISQG
jgi:hypothetical protein